MNAPQQDRFISLYDDTQGLLCIHHNGPALNRELSCYLQAAASDDTTTIRLLGKEYVHRFRQVSTSTHDDFGISALMKRDTLLSILLPRLEESQQQRSFSVKQKADIGCSLTSRSMWSVCQCCGSTRSHSSGPRNDRGPPSGDLLLGCDSRDSNVYKMASFLTRQSTYASTSPKGLPVPASISTKPPPQSHVISHMFRNAC